MLCVYICILIKMLLVILFLQKGYNICSFPRSNNPPRNPQGPGFLRGFHGSSIPVNGSGDQIYPFSRGAYRSLSKPAAGSLHRILAPDFRHFQTGSGRKRWVSWGFSPEIHGILRQELSSWVCIYTGELQSGSGPGTEILFFTGTKFTQVVP
jgi:hypothetical protein